MRKTLIMLVLLLSVFTLSLMGADLITQEGTNTLIVSGKTLRIVIDIEKGLLTGVTSFADNKGVEFYAYNESLGKDGFNIFDQQGNELLPQSFSRTTDAEGNVVVDFFYQQGRKSFVILTARTTISTS